MRAALVYSAVVGFLLGAVLLAGCTTITEIREISCERIDFYPLGATAMQADSAIYRDCDPPEWDGMVVRFRR